MARCSLLLAAPNVSLAQEGEGEACAGPAELVGDLGGPAGFGASELVPDCHGQDGCATPGDGRPGQVCAA